MNDVLSVSSPALLLSASHSVPSQSSTNVLFQPHPPMTPLTSLHTECHKLRDIHLPAESMPPFFPPAFSLEGPFFHCSFWQTLAQPILNYLFAGISQAIPTPTYLRVTMSFSELLLWMLLPQNFSIIHYLNVCHPLPRYCQHLEGNRYFLNLFKFIFYVRIIIY